jgi:hypothetical protein
MRLVSSIAPPKRVMGEFSKAFPFKTGLDVFISAMFFSFIVTKANLYLAGRARGKPVIQV